MTPVILLAAAVLLVAFGGLMAAVDAAFSVSSRSDLEELASASNARNARALEAIAADPDPHVNAVAFMRVLSETTAAVQAEHPQVASEVRFVHGRPAAVLDEESATSDLLVLERRPHAFHGAHLGRTARALIKTSRCAIVVVPPLGSSVPERAGSAGGARV